jgi:predicted nuclease of predicted toxin-antitoxin system
MALKFYFDTHIAKAIAVQLRIKGVDVLRCEEVGMAEASDESHLLYATEQERIMITQDDDFLLLDMQWRNRGEKHAGIMRVPVLLQGQAQISFVIEQVLFYDEAERAGAINYLTEIHNQVIYL